MSAGRGDRLVELIAAEGLDQLLVTNLVNVGYLTGFGGTAGMCLASADERLFFTDFRYTERAKQELRDGWELVPMERDPLPAIVARFKGRVGFEDAEMPVRQHGKLSKELGDSAELVPAGTLVEKLRQVKDEAELKAITAAAALADEVYQWLIERGLTGSVERDVGREIEARFRELGAEPSFPPIVASGPNSALPHAEPGDREIGKGELVTVDMGAKLDGYCSDCTRTFATGEIPDEQRETYELVLKAQAAGLDAVKAGAEGKAVDAVAREMIEAAGHGDGFGHGLGHGVGLEVHEGPVLATRSEDTLAENEVVTVEPGVYIEGSHGVRIEDLVVVTAEGHRNLSSRTKDLEVVA